MRRRGRIHWYDLVFFALAAVVVYPDKVLDWIGGKTGRAFGWVHLVLLEVVAIAAIATAVSVLMPIYPKLQWWMPLVDVGLLAVFRAISWILVEMFGLGE